MIREITIKPVLNGYVCKVGCQEIVFQNRNEMLKEIGRYYEDPEGTEAKFKKNAVNKICPDSDLLYSPGSNTIASTTIPSLGTTTISR